VGERALPLAWRVKKTQGAIGFREQRAALATVAALLPEGVRPTLMGDRFYGSPALITWCRDHGWGWRLRCKQDLRVFDTGRETTLAECFARGEHGLEDVALTGKRARTHVAMVHADGQAEPWIIAMSDRPTPERARDYGLRWGIEAMFSDFKTRGFNLEASQIERTDRLDRLVLVLALALYWAVSTGLWDATENRTAVEKKPQQRNARMSPAA
jgi:Transposase DDE domain